MIREVEQWPHSGPQFFPAGDARQGAYKPGVRYRVMEEPKEPSEITLATAEALVGGGGFRWVEAEEAAPRKARKGGEAQ